MLRMEPVTLPGLPATVVTLCNGSIDDPLWREGLHVRLLWVTTAPTTESPTLPDARALDERI